MNVEREIIEETDMKNTIIIKLYEENVKRDERMLKDKFFF